MYVCYPIDAGGLGRGMMMMMMRSTFHIFMYVDRWYVCIHPSCQCLYMYHDDDDLNERTSEGVYTFCRPRCVLFVLQLTAHDDKIDPLDSPVSR
jgi:hypothetical protein